jgi:hypothetical protein
MRATAGLLLGGIRGVLITLLQWGVVPDPSYLRFLARMAVGNALGFATMGPDTSELAVGGETFLRPRGAPGMIRGTDGAYPEVRSARMKLTDVSRCGSVRWTRNGGRWARFRMS